MTVQKHISGANSICFVTNELYPLSPGGIGRLMYNFANYNKEVGSNTSIHFVVPSELLAEPEKRQAAEAAFEDLAHLHICPSIDSLPDEFSALLTSSVKENFNFDAHFTQSYLYYKGLLQAQKDFGKTFDIIEFPDFGGWAIATIEAKRANRDFQETIISARIHSTQGVLYEKERFSYYPSEWHGIQIDAERHLLEHADMIIGHNQAIIDFNKSHYGFGDEWSEKTIYEFPPIIDDKQVASKADLLYESYLEDSETKLSEADFLFSGRLQQIKRPDLFIKAAVIFLEDKPNYSGTFRLVSYGWDQTYISSLHSLIPANLKQKIIFVEDSSKEEREFYIRSSVVVVPSDYESLCLFAFEAANVDSKVILNHKCMPFAQSDRWVENENCLMFDGSATDLAEIMQKSIDWKPVKKVSLEASIPYWCNKKNLPVKTIPKASGIKLTIICYGFETKEELDYHIACMSELDNEIHDIIFLAPSAYFPKNDEIFETIRSKNWNVISVPGFGYDPADLHKFVLSIGSDLFCFIPYGYEIHPKYMEAAIDAFRHDPSLDVCGGHIRVLDEKYGYSISVLCFAGTMPNFALVSSRIAPTISVIRKATLQNIPFDSRAGTNWFAAWARDCAISGKNLLIMPSLAADLSSDTKRYNTTKKLIGGIINNASHLADFKGRFLSLDLSQYPSDEETNKNIIVSDAELYAVKQLYPDRNARDFQLVAMKPDLGGVLVHPLNDFATIAEYIWTGRRLSRVHAHAYNASDKNSGIEAAIAIVPPNADIETIKTFISSEKKPPRAFNISKWELIRPGHEAELTMSVINESFGENDRILLLSRIPKNGDDYYCHLVYRSLHLNLQMNKL